MGCGASGLRPFAEAFELQEVVGKAAGLRAVEGGGKWAEEGRGATGSFCRFSSGGSCLVRPRDLLGFDLVFGNWKA